MGAPDGGNVRRKGALAVHRARRPVVKPTLTTPLVAMMLAVADGGNMIERAPAMTRPRPSARSNRTP